MELVSVVVPVYKVEDYLEKCIRSIQNQTYSNLEIILVDDGSPDRCGEICEEFAVKDERIKVFHKENGGLSDARNYGVQYATGKYLLFVDSDDYISETLIEKTVNAAETHSCDFVLFDYYYVKNGIEEVRTCEEIPKNKVISLKKEKSLFTMPPSAWSKLFNREFYMNSGIEFPKGLYFEDLGTTPKFLLQAENIFYLKEPLYYYMIRSTSIMGNQNYERKYNDMILILNQVLDYYKTKGLFEQYREELEFLVFKNAFFEPVRELVLVHQEGDYADKYRSYVYGKFPKVNRNPYVKQMKKKDRLHLLILNLRQYWIMRMLSKCRQAAERMQKS